VSEPVYDRDGIKLYCGDNCETMLQMEPASVDLVVTSPPYDDLRTYGGHSWDFYGVAWNLKRLLKPGGVIVWVVNDKTEDGDESGSSFRQALHFKDVGLKLWDTMIWDKPWCQYGDMASRYAGTFEYSFVFSRGRPSRINIIKDRPNTNVGGVKTQRYDRRVTGDGGGNTGRAIPYIVPEFGTRKAIWEVAVGGESFEVNGISHPAIFPEDLARDHILSWSNEGDIVLDPFSGSGTTIKMARETGRRGIGIEINKEYCDIAVKRLEQRLLFGIEPVTTA